MAITSFFPFSCDGGLARPIGSEGGSDDRVDSVILVGRDECCAGASLESLGSVTFFLLPSADDDLPDATRGFRTFATVSLPSVAVAVEDLLFSFLIFGSLFLRGFLTAGVFLARADSTDSSPR